MRGVPAEFQNVPLGDSHVLDQLPRGVGDTGALGATQRGGKTRHRGIEIGVSAAFTQKIREVFA